ncbi:MAG: glycerol-3-phosphate 1-O-acyltransferase PlsY [Planctomycetaceae bacterium]|nr:glycerol-3-phosphate 1-O-acyltransferase PlsY [Planctomycetaceae bacterium]
MIAAFFLFAYLLGSIPFGLLLGKLAGRDIRLEGSRNIGATNLWRVCGWKLGLLGFVLDFLKGLVPVLATARFGPAGWWPWPVIGAGVLAVAGHMFPVWLRFKGGKGVATSAGVVAGLMPGPFGLAMLAFVLTVATFRYISLGSMVASVVLVLAALVLLPSPFGSNLPLLLMAVLLAALILFRHRDNIRRIRNGTENRFPPPKKTA